MALSPADPVVREAVPVGVVSVAVEVSVEGFRVVAVLVSVAAV